MNRLAGMEKPRSWKATNDTTNPLGGHGLVAGDLPLDGGGERRKLTRLIRQRSYSGETLECVQFDIAAAESRADWKHKKQRRCGCGRTRIAGSERERKKTMGKQSPEPAPDVWF
jgi:hypothetical protein